MDLELRGYWDRTAPHQTFTHPLRTEWLEPLGRDARILDYGCGYGRVTAQLHEQGWRNAVGVDVSAELVARGRREHPGLDLRVIDALPLAEPDGAFDAVLLFAVLTCIPRDEDQTALVTELRRLLSPGGLLYVSDYPLQSDERNVSRYRASLARHGVYGVWDRDDGGVFRHHDMAWLDQLLSDFNRLASATFRNPTLSGAPADVVQILASRR